MQLTATEAAKRLGKSRQWIVALARQGKLQGNQLADGTWLIESSSLNLHRRTTPGAGRPWAPLASWAVLAELEGTPIWGLEPYLIRRVHDRIRSFSAVEIARKVAGRVQWTTYATDDLRTVEEAVVLTGSSAASWLDASLTVSSKGVQGYFDSERGSERPSVGNAIVLPDSTGSVRLAPPVPFWEFDRVAPTAVIAADLVATSDPREEAVGIRVLAGQRERWLATHDQ